MLVRRAIRLAKPAALARSPYVSVWWVKELSVPSPRVADARAVDGRAVVVLLLQVKVVGGPKQP